MAQSIDMEELKRRLQTTYRAERDDSVARTGVLFSNIPPAPEQYQRMWDDNDPDITRGTIVDKDEMRLGACAAERFWAPSDTIGSGNE